MKISNFNGRLYLNVAHDEVEAAAKALAARGYALISRKYNILSRIDRATWVEVFTKDLGHDKKWMQSVTISELADHYRRVYSKDQISVPAAVAALMPKSADGGSDLIRFIP